MRSTNLPSDSEEEDSVYDLQGNLIAFRDVQLLQNPALFHFDALFQRDRSAAESVRRVSTAPVVPQLSTRVPPLPDFLRSGDATGDSASSGLIKREPLQMSSTLPSSSESLLPSFPDLRTRLPPRRHRASEAHPAIPHPPTSRPRSRLPGWKYSIPPHAESALRPDFEREALAKNAQRKSELSARTRARTAFVKGSHKLIPEKRPGRGAGLSLGSFVDRTVAKTRIPNRLGSGRSQVSRRLYAPSGGAGAGAGAGGVIDPSSAPRVVLRTNVPSLLPAAASLTRLRDNRPLGKRPVLPPIRGPTRDLSASGIPPIESPGFDFSPELIGLPPIDDDTAEVPIDPVRGMASTESSSKRVAPSTSTQKKATVEPPKKKPRLLSLIPKHQTTSKSRLNLGDSNLRLHGSSSTEPSTEKVVPSISTQKATKRPKKRVRSLIPKPPANCKPRVDSLNLKDSRLRLPSLPQQRRKRKKRKTSLRRRPKKSRRN